MTRQLRKQSATGIHHVMLRGINRQTMFEDDDDFRLSVGPGPSDRLLLAVGANDFVDV